MARARNIKPGFFKNELLAECSAWARLCFAGLWTLADRDGRLEDRPKRIKADLFAYDSVEVEPLLKELEKYGFLVRYQNSDGLFIQICKFMEHQTPHYSEKHSVIKPPELQESGRDDELEKPRELRENSKSEPVFKRGSQPPDSLIPDSLIPDSLIPDSLIPEKTNTRSASYTRPVPATKAGEACLAMREAGLQSTSPSHQKLVALCAAGASIDEFRSAAIEAKDRGKGFSYALGIVEGRRRDATEIAALTSAPTTRNGASFANQRDQERRNAADILTGKRAPAAPGVERVIEGIATEAS